MPHRTYSLEFKRRVVADAVLAGAPFAAVRHGIDVRTVRDWLTRAGRAPIEAIGSADWEQLGEAARAKVAVDLAAGKVSAVQAATIAAIAARNAVKPEPPPPPPDTTEQLVDIWLEEIDKIYPEQAGLALICLIHGVREDPAILDDPLAYLASLGPLEAALAGYRQRQHEEMEAQIARNRAAREAMILEAMDDETSSSSGPRCSGANR